MKVTTVISALTFLVATAQATAIPAAEGEVHEIVARQPGWCSPGDLDCYCRQPQNRDSRDCICYRNPRAPGCHRPPPPPPPPQWCDRRDRNYWDCCRRNPRARGCDNRPPPPPQWCQPRDWQCCRQNPRARGCDNHGGRPPCNGDRECCRTRPDNTCGWQPGRPRGQ